MHDLGGELCRSGARAAGGEAGPAGRLLASGPAGRLLASGLVGPWLASWRLWHAQGPSVPGLPPRGGQPCARLDDEILLPADRLAPADLDQDVARVDAESLRRAERVLQEAARHPGQ